MMLLSQLEKVDPGYFRDWIIVLCCVMGAVLMVMNLVEKFKAKKAGHMMIGPDPLPVQEVERLATKAELQDMSVRLRSDIDGLRRSIDDEKRTNYAENSKLHHRVDELVETLAEQKGLLIGVKDNTDRLVARSMK